MNTRFLVLALMLILARQAEAQTFKMKLSEHSSNVEAIAFSADGKSVATGGWDGSINLYTLDTAGTPVLKTTFTGHLGAVSSLNFTPNGKYLVSSSKDYSSRIWNLDTPSRHKVFNLHLEPVTASFIDPGYKYLISASLDGTIRMTLISDALKSRVIRLSGPVNDLKMSRDRKFYYAALKGGIIKKYETGGKNNEVMSLLGHSDEINAIELSPDGNFLASASSDKTIQIWDLSSGKSIKKLNGFEWKVTSVRYSSDGRYILGGCNDGITKLYDVGSGKHLADFSGHGKNVRDVAFSKDGKHIFVATLMDADQFGAVIYNSGVSTQAAQPAAPAKNANAPKNKPGSTPKNSQAANLSASPKKPNGTK